MNEDNPMRKIRIEKIVLNIGLGTSGNYENAKRVLESLTQCKAVPTRTRKRTTFNVPKGRVIGCKVTVRKDTDKLFKKLIEGRENRLEKSCFDDGGNLSFGIKEYIDIPEMRYDPKIGIIGFDVCIRLERPGFSISRKKTRSKIGKRHRITKEEAMKFISERFGVVIE
jgi:large subunit ribosomal protein L5